MGLLITQILGIADQIFLMPITGLYLHTGGVNWVYAGQLGSESNWNVEGIQRTNKKGQTIIIGYRFTGSIYIPNNQYIESNLIETLETMNASIAAGEQLICHVHLGTYDLPIADPPIPINSTHGARINFGNDACFNYKIESVEVMPRMIISLSGIIKGNLKNYIQYKEIV